MLQNSNVICYIRMYILCNKMMYFGDFVVLVPCISIGIYIYHLTNMNISWFLYKISYFKGMLLPVGACIFTCRDNSKQICIEENI